MHSPTIAKYFVILMVIASSYLEAAIACDEPVARVLSTQGRVEVQSFGSPIWRKINPEEPLCDGDVVHTGKWSRATIVNASGTGFTLTQNGTLTVSAPPQAEEKQPSWYIKLIQGAAFFRSHHPERHNIQTPFINLVNKGTEFLVEVGDNRTDISVFDGQVVAENKAGKIQINNGQKGTAESNRPPQLQMLKVTPEDAVQWALYYPPIINDTDDGGSDGNSAINLALAAYRQGDVQAALAVLANLPPAQQTPRTLTLQAALLLTVGRLDEAQPLIRQAHQQVPNNSDAFALEAVIAVAKNRGQAALLAANQAVAANPKSPVAHIAQSYAHQAVFDIEAALQATQEALKLAPNNALAWARQAELQLSTGDKAAALAAASKAQALNPRLARSQIVLGFANLAQTQLDEAKSAFQQALTLDSTDPLARLGLGLAKIRRGDLDAGKIDLESAVNLDPNNAVARSYLGKAYYELRNKDFASKEFEIAKMMDSKDPTPYFYDAILKQTTNRPVEALRDMQKAKELNDNRAVYRSSLLLDKDLAARSAGLGRIYNDLGFQRLGLVEGWTSVNTDPSNYSAHRLLADNYASQPRHEIARVSELLQSQLLQPLNITPVQPQLAQSNILIVDGLGPTSLSFNEYNPLFAHNRFALQSSGIVASNNTWGEDVVHSGLWGKGSYSLGQYHYETDGFRENNFVNQDIYNAFVQGDISDNLNLQAEYRHEDRENGDLSVNFDKSLFSPDTVETRTIDTYRLGSRITFSPGSSLLGSLIYQEVEFENKIPGLVSTQTSRNGFISELQHHYNDAKFNSITGFGHINQFVKTTTKFLDFPDDPLPPTKQDITKTSLYNYTNIKLSEQLMATLGVSYDAFKFENDIKKNPINPKLGLIWKPMSSTTFRAALFRAMNITGLSNQTIEPTQIAGFNQFFDDPTGTVAWRYGAAIDHKFSNNFSAGLEYTERKLDVPDTAFRSVNWSEQLGRAYLYVTPSDLSSVGVEYFYERFNRDENALSLGVRNVSTQWIPVTLSVFHPSGLSFAFRSTYVNQSGVFDDIGVPYSGDSDFFIFDVNLSYRLPQRYGMLNVGIKNLFNNRFNFQSTNQVNSNEQLFAPEMTLFGQLKLAF